MGRKEDRTLFQISSTVPTFTLFNSKENLLNGEVRPLSPRVTFLKLKVTDWLNDDREIDRFTYFREYFREYHKLKVLDHLLVLS